MSVHWTTHELDGRRFDPEPPPDDEDDGPYCGTLDLGSQGVTPEQVVAMTTLKPPRRYL